MTTENRPPLASVIVSSYNYGRFLTEAIDSALAQTCPDTEVIVVDDGSIDDSREIMAGYGRRITAVLKDNGGQASALNAGFSVSRGQVLFFLDSDDVLLPTAVERAVTLFRDPDVAKVHWPLVAVDEHGSRTGRVIPGSMLPEGNLREAVIRDGPYGYAWPDTSGNAWARRFIQRVFPIPEMEYRTAPDLYLAAFAPLFGAVGQIPEALALYRDHAANHSRRRSFTERVMEGRWREQHCLEALATYCRSNGVTVDPERWKANAWWHQVHRAVEEVLRLVPAGESFILVDEDHWGLGDDLEARRRIPFLERNGEYWGEPPDDAIAIRELERLREAGAGFIVFGWPYLWWLDHYHGLTQHLRSKFSCVRENDALVVFDLRP